MIPYLGNLRRINENNHYTLDVKDTILYGYKYPIINQKNKSFNGKNLAIYLRFEPGTLGFQFGIVTN
jgi:hypothetical protein